MKGFSEFTDRVQKFLQDIKKDQSFKEVTKEEWENIEIRLDNACCDFPLDKEDIELLKGKKRKK